MNMRSTPVAPTALKPTRPLSRSAPRGGQQQPVPKVAPTPPLTRSLSSSPSSSTLPEEEITSLTDELSIVYATGLDSLDLDLDEVHSVVSPRSVRKKLLSASTSTFVPNPHAIPYLPTIVRKRHAADPCNCTSDIAPVWLPHREWMRPMQGGALATQTGVRRSYAKKVVETGPWDTAMISELAAKIVELAAEGSEADAKVDTMKSVALFSQQVQESFKQMLGDDPAKTFGQLLKQCLLSEYRAWWLSTLSSAVALIPTNSLSPPHANPRRLLTSALGVADFVGATFAVGLTSGSYVMLCINMLLDRLSVVEELRALQGLIKHAGDALYECTQMDDFLADLQKRVTGLEDGASAVGETGVKQQAQAIYEDIEQTIQSWAQARATPTLTEFSDTATEYSDYNPEFTVHRTAMAPEVAPLRVAQSTPRSPTSPPGLTARPALPTGESARDQMWSRVSSTRTVRAGDCAPPSRIPRSQAVRH